MGINKHREVIRASAISEKIKKMDEDNEIDRSPVMWAIALAFFGAACYAYIKGDQEVQNSKAVISGKVVSEAYMPASAAFLNSIESRYSFSMETPFGVKGVQVNGDGKESIDSLIEKGSNVEVKTLDYLRNIYHVSPSDVTVR